MKSEFVRNYKDMRILFIQSGLCLIIILSISFIVTSCQQVKDIPGQVSEDIPNPVEDFTQKDRFKLGLRWYQQGEFDIAKKMWKPLAENGDCDAEYALGLLYFNGLGVRKNRDNAILWWGRAAEQAQPQALNSLGVVYAHMRVLYTTLDCRKGCGEAKNLVEAYKWFGLAKKYGPPREVDFAGKSLERISLEMSENEIEKAKTLINSWAPKPAECESRDLFIVN